MIRKILAAPINLFFDTTPSGLIVNRLAGDLCHIQGAFWALFFNLTTFYGVCTIIVIISTARLELLIVFPFMVLWLIFVFKYTIGPYREMFRLLATQSSPIITHLGESIQGNSTIRAFKRQD